MWAEGERIRRGKGRERLAGHVLVAGRRRGDFRRRLLCRFFQPPSGTGRRRAEE
jgi:hypothetical protein